MPDWYERPPKPVSFHKREPRLHVFFLRQPCPAPAAVDEEDLAGHAAGLLGGQERHAVGDLFRLQHPLHGNHQHIVVHIDDAVFDADPEQLRIHKARRHAVDADIEAAPLHRQSSHPALVML